MNQTEKTIPSYEYAEGDRLQNPHTYMYTRYEGGQFLTSYMKNRRDALGVLMARCSDNYLFHKKMITIPDFAGQVSSSDVDAVWKCVHRAEEQRIIPAADILMTTLLRIKHGNESDLDALYDILSRFISKYETFKRIFSHYDCRLRKAGDDSTRLECYILLSLNLVLYYRQRQNLKFLNAALKINDAICSVTERLHAEKDALRFCWSLTLEIEAVSALMEKKKI